LPAFGQDVDDLKDRFPVVNAYEVLPGVLMIPRFGDDGRVCQMTVEKRLGLTPKDGEMSTAFSSKEIKQVEDLLAPPSERGEEAQRLLPGSFVAGEASHIERGFEHMIIEEDGGTSSGVSLITIRWKERASR
jgi:hypothetical protein